MDENFYGDETQNDLMYMINKHKGEDEDMVNFETSIRELTEEIASYEETAREAEAAMDSAEKELNEILEDLPY